MIIHVCLMYQSVHCIDRLHSSVAQISKICFFWGFFFKSKKERDGVCAAMNQCILLSNLANDKITEKLREHALALDQFSV